MSSEVDICNLALSHLGDSATVASLDPPEGSAQAEHCARFYPIARDALLELFEWNFATKRRVPAEVVNNWAQWDHAYARPADCLKVIAVQDPSATDDTAYSYNGLITRLVPQPYACETDDNGAQIILTDQATALCRYVARVTDTTKFSPTFTVALSWYLASMLAGPVLKGDLAVTETRRCEDMARVWIEKAKATDVQQQQRDTEQTPAPSWIGER